MRLKRSGAHGVKLSAAVVEQCLARTRSRPEQDGSQIQAIDDAVLGNFRSGQAESGREQIHGAGQFVADRTGWDAARPPRNARFAHAAFPSRTLAFPEWTR